MLNRIISHKILAFVCNMLLKSLCQWYAVPVAIFLSLPCSCAYSLDVLRHSRLRVMGTLPLQSSRFVCMQEHCRYANEYSCQ